MAETNFVMSVRQASELDHAFARNGWTADMVKTLSQGDMLGRVLSVILGDAAIRPIQRIIDCDSPAFVPEGWQILPDTEQLPQRLLGKIHFDPQNLDLYLPLVQQMNGLVGEHLLKLLKDSEVRVYTAHVLDYLLANQHLIPQGKGWKKKQLFFWGTLYLHENGFVCVRYLYWNSMEWVWSYYALNVMLEENDPAAVVPV